MVALGKVADISHKALVTGLFAFTGFNLYQIIGQVKGKSLQEQEHPQAGFIEMLRKKAEEEYTKRFDISHRDWYDKDDSSYLKSIPRPEQYSKKNDK